MKEAAYSYIDYCMLWISAGQLVLSIAGMIGIVYSILSYRHAVKNQTESEALTRDTINSLKLLIELQSKSHEFEKLNVRIQSKPLFVNHKRSSIKESTLYIILKNTGQTANNIQLNIINSNEWKLLNDDTLRRNILIGEEVIIHIECKSATEFTRDEINKQRHYASHTNFDLELIFQDAIGNLCKQRITGSFFDFIVSDVEYV